MRKALLLLVIVAAPAWLRGQESDPEKAARAAALRYENRLRERAPYSSGPTAGECDEVVGRFCLRFGDNADTAPPRVGEHPDITEARRRVIGAYRVWLGGAPESGTAAGGLVRYLIEDGRPREAVAVARAHAGAAPGTESLLFLGLALYSSGSIVEAEAAFDSARALAGPAEREALDDLTVLLGPRERDRYRALDPGSRAVYAGRFWAFSDPSRLADGNERRAAHYARHAWIRILGAAPRARGALSWGDDHAEIALRYGAPFGWERERVRRRPFRLTWEDRAVFSFGYGSVSLVPAALLTEGIPPVPEPGTRPELERDDATASYRPVRLHGLRGLEAQVTRIPGLRDWILRVDAVLHTDTMPPGSLPAPEALLTVLDTLGHEVARAPLAVEATGTGPALLLRGELPLPSGTYVFQVEAADTATGIAGRMLHRIELPAGGLMVADPLVARPTGRPPPDRRGLRPFPTRTVEVGGTVTVWTTVRGLARAGGASRYAVECWLEPRDPGTAVGRVVGWLGRTLGLAADERPIRVRWEDTARDSGPVPIVFELTLEGVDPGPYRLGLRVRDRLSGAETTSYRELLLEAAP